MPVAEIIAIGTELLLGEIQDTNTRHIARMLRNAGIDLYRTTIVGDNENRIAAVVKEAISRSEIILTTGGLGPTVDDPTRNAIAKALGVETEFRPELWEQIQKRFARYGRIPRENNRKQAFIPQNAVAIENPVGTAPAFAAETGNGVLISMPGVPREMEYLLENTVTPYLKNRYHLEGIIKAFVIHTSGLGESVIDEQIEDLETISNPTVGLVAYPGQIDIRVTAKASSVEIADKMIAEVVEVIETRLGNAIFGYNETTSLQVVTSQLLATNKKLAVIESGFEDKLSNVFKENNLLDERTAKIDEHLTLNELEKYVENLYKQVSPNIAVGATVNHQEDESEINMVMIKDGKKYQKSRFFVGHANLAPLWAMNTILDFIRRNSLELQE